ncbi:MAG: DUF308 domain-containing protein [Phycisphaerales bacterium]|jgi:uncharacterized membrane protein HdeD (DUF308 family)|nr:DUF308 domain-containing protein [Phycisphaerales bacterium]
MTTAAAPTQPTPAQVQELLRQGKGLLLFEGIVCLLGGVLSIIFPAIASEGLELMLGVLAVMIGVLGLIRSCVGGAEHRGATAVSAILIGALGVLLLVWPFEGLEAITLVLGIVSLIRGVSDLTGFPFRSMTSPGLQVLSGIAGIAVAVMLFLWYPSDALWAPGLLFGIQLIFFGMTLLSLWNAVNGSVASPPETRPID